MQLPAIKSDAWYAEQRRYGWPDAVIMFGQNRFSAERTYVEERGYVVRLRETPEAKLGGRRNPTGLLGISLSSERDDVRQWVEDGERADAKPELMLLAERLIKEIGERATHSDSIDFDEARKIVTDACEPNANGLHPLRLIMVQPRQLTGPFVEDHLARLEHDRLKREAQALDNAERQRAAKLRVQTKALATRLGLDKGIYFGDDTVVRVPMSKLRALFEEIERLRELNTATLRADETGEAEPRG
ncbi:MAG TPA: hypothetical protein VE476_10585 [Propionibacteriaceae bacterium]|nr:hypothetical protein [Propionibacteriaceae bacterium]